MKNFTKYLATLVFSVGLFSASNAQSDLKVFRINPNTPPNGATVNTIVTYPMNISFVNLGPNPLGGSTDVEIDTYINGVLQTYPTAFPTPAAGMAVLTDTFIFNPTPTIRYNVSPIPNNMRVCWNVRALGSFDPNLDTFCVTYNVNPGTTVDFALNNLKVTTPNLGKDDPVGANGETITAMNVTVINNGNFAYPAGYQFQYTLEVEGGSPVTLNATLGQDLAPGDSSVRNIISFPPLPSAGPFRMCARLVVSNDVDPNNNVTCTPYFVSVVGIEDIENAEPVTSVHFNNGAEVLDVFLSEKLKGTFKMNVTSISGQSIAVKEALATGQEKEQIELSGIAKGLYVLSIESEIGDIQAQKFMVN